MKRKRNRIRRGWKRGEMEREKRKREGTDIDIRKKGKGRGKRWKRARNKSYSLRKGRVASRLPWYVYQAVRVF